GFAPLGYKGLETGSRSVASHAVAQNGIVFVFQSALTPGNDAFGKFCSTHGDAVKDVAFSVNNCRAIWQKAVERGAKTVREPWEETDEHGTVVMATIATNYDVEHTFIERTNYKGLFLPGYFPVAPDPITSLLPPTPLLQIDHIVSNQPHDQMLPTCDLYESQLSFHRFWSVDDSQIHTDYSSLRSIVMADDDEVVKMPVNEPAPGKGKSQVEEFVEYSGGGGVQHVALRTDDIVGAVKNLRTRGVEFLEIPPTYYTTLQTRLSHSTTNKFTISEPLSVLQDLHILIDYDTEGYLLQIFTKPLEDRPTLFVEIIQRKGHDGFGAGNFRALFEAIEGEQGKRGNLTNEPIKVVC
ncbi:hypothetical protein HK097_010965, partial [Rhizophlyctis rosea]